MKRFLGYYFRLRKLLYDTLKSHKEANSSTCWRKYDATDAVRGVSGEMIDGIILRRNFRGSYQYRKINDHEEYKADQLFVDSIW